MDFGLCDAVFGVGSIIVGLDFYSKRDGLMSFVRDNLLAFGILRFGLVCLLSAMNMPICQLKV